MVKIGKNSILLFMLFLLNSGFWGFNPLFSQELTDEKNGYIKKETIRKERSFYYGIISGIGLAMVSSHQKENTNPHIGCKVGFISGYDLFPNATLETGLIVSKKGFNEKINQQGYSFKVANSFYYADLPLVLRYAVKPDIFFYAGPQISVFIRHVAKVDGDKRGSSDGVSLLNYSLIFGPGYSVSEKIQITAGFEFGLNTLDAGKGFALYHRNMYAGIRIFLSR